MVCFPPFDNFFPTFILKIMGGCCCKGTKPCPTTKTASRPCDTTVLLTAPDVIPPIGTPCLRCFSRPCNPQWRLCEVCFALGCTPPSASINVPQRSSCPHGICVARNHSVPKTTLNQYGICTSHACATCGGPVSERVCLWNNHTPPVGTEVINF